MKTPKPHLPQEIFANPATGASAPPRVFVSPQRYIQGDGVFDELGRYLSLLDARNVAVLVSARGLQELRGRMLESVRANGIKTVFRTFKGECSLLEIESHVHSLTEESIDCVIAVGGGKCIDTAKAIAFRLSAPVIVVPTLASNDAPCSALSVLYTPEGVSMDVEFYPENPAMVVVDTGIVAAAPERYLVAGMGDAMATWYEARVCLQNEAARTTVGARPTLASCALGEICAQTLFREGLAAAAAVRENNVTASLEEVVEANTLLSGLGFESGGLAAAHAIAQSYTGIPSVHANYLHGEMVAMGTLTQLMIESRSDDAKKVAEFFANVGLPIHLGQVGLEVNDTSALDTLVQGALDFPFIHNMPPPIDGQIIRDAVLDAHDLGLIVCEQLGDEAYRRLRKD